MKVAFQTLGCRVNVYDTEAMTEIFLKDGYERVGFSEWADVYVINTCTVTHMGDRKSRQYINKARKKNPQAIVAVVGCYSQVNQEEVQAFPGVDVVLGSRNKSDVVFYVNKAMAERRQIVKVSDNLLLNHVFEELDVVDYEGKTRAFLKIQDGCNRFCAYCIIPYARGGLSSRSSQKVLQEIRSLVDHGFKEVILSGIHIASYGLELPGGGGLLELLEEVEQVEGLMRVRIGSIEPMFFKGDALERVKRLTKLQPHFHLSLQSGCDATLKRMNRRYTVAEYRAVVEALRREIPEVSITTDVIVGFPGETREEFERTMGFLRELRLNRIHVFKFSPRQGTPAERMADPVDGPEKERRSKEVLALSAEMEAATLEAMRGRCFQVLLEEGAQGVHHGYTPSYVRVRVTSDQDIQGDIHLVRITGRQGDVALGECVSRAIIEEKRGVM